MAKRTPPRSQNSDASTKPDQPQSKRPRARRDNTTVGDPVALANDTAPTTPSELPDIPEPGDAADRALRSESMSSEPSEDDIRLRAYHRYLERGGRHGGHFDDWLEAERELKGPRSRS